LPGTGTKAGAATRTATADGVARRTAARPSLTLFIATLLDHPRPVQATGPLIRVVGDAGVGVE
jgi:hypothetical protein